MRIYSSSSSSMVFSFAGGLAAIISIEPDKLEEQLKPLLIATGVGPAGSADLVTGSGGGFDC
jgi:hypothetical protein